MNLTALPYLIHTSKSIWRQQRREWDWTPYRAHRTRDGKTALCGVLVSGTLHMAWTSPTPTLGESKVTVCAACRKLANGAPTAPPAGPAPTGGAP